MRPFKPGDRLIDHAVPIAEVMQQLRTQLAEYKALKEHLADVAGTATVSTKSSDPTIQGGAATVSHESSSSSLPHRFGSVDSTETQYGDTLSSPNHSNTPTEPSL